MSKPLKPCPFCGGLVRIVIGEECAYVQCEDMKMHRALWLDGDTTVADEVAEQWNRREERNPPFPEWCVPKTIGVIEDAAVAELRKERDLAVAQNERLWAANHSLVAEQDRLAAELAAAQQREAELREDKAGLQDQIGKMLGMLDDWDQERANEMNGGLIMHTYGQTPVWYVEAAFWSCYGYGPADPRAALSDNGRGE